MRDGWHVDALKHLTAVAIDTDAAITLRLCDGSGNGQSGETTHHPDEL